MCCKVHGIDGSHTIDKAALEENPNRIRIFNTELEFITPKPQNAKAILMERGVKDFIGSILSEKTRKTYIVLLEIFEKYTNRPISEIIKQRRIELTTSLLRLREDLK